MNKFCQDPAGSMVPDGIASEIDEQTVTEIEDTNLEQSTLSQSFKRLLMKTGESEAWHCRSCF